MGVENKQGGFEASSFLSIIEISTKANIERENEKNNIMKYHYLLCAFLRHVAFSKK